MAGIYVHIPYCHSKCAYCDFYSTPNTVGMESLIDNICREYNIRKYELDEPVKTLYFGGGTPSIIPLALLEKIFKVIPTNDIEEITIEVNPEDVTKDRVKEWKSLGINRVSMGVQSLIDTELQLIGRRHNALDAINAVDTLRKNGIENISLDLIYGLPDQDTKSWCHSLNGVLALKPNHISAYILSYEPKTKLTSMLKSGKVQATSENTIIEMYNVLTKRMREEGYEHYEISNFALQGYRSRHNSSYWDRTPYLGLGPSAHSYDGKTRRINISDIRKYNTLLDDGKYPYEIDEETRANKFNDLIMTRLRTRDGLNFSSVPLSRRRGLLTDAYHHILKGNIIADGLNLTIPEDKWLISDSIIRDLIQTD